MTIWLDIPGFIFLVGSIAYHKPRSFLLAGNLSSQFFEMKSPLSLNNSLKWLQLYNSGRNFFEDFVTSQNKLFSSAKTWMSYQVGLEWFIQLPSVFIFARLLITSRLYAHSDEFFRLSFLSLQNGWGRLCIFHIWSQ